MPDHGRTTIGQAGVRSQSSPPGRIKIMEALRSLLEDKEFTAITTAEIARTAGVTEGLIYKYFQDKRDLLHQVLAEYVERFVAQIEMDLKGIKGALNKLRKIIWTHFYMYAADRVFARILLVEVRNVPDYFQSDAYAIVRRYTDLLGSIIEEGVAEGVIMDDVPVASIRQVVLGGIEHLCLRHVIFNREIDPDQLHNDLCEILFRGIARGSQPT